MSQIIATVVEAGFSTTFQDLGRSSGRAYGVPPGGGLDRLAQQAANQLVGNLPTAATLEIILRAPTLHFETEALISITGANFQPVVDGVPRPLWASLYIRAGQTLAFQAQAQAAGRLAYLAVHGGWEAPLFMGSRSTYLRGGMGRVLSVGDTLTSGQAYFRPLKHYAQEAGKFYPGSKIPIYSGELTARVIPGPFWQHFSEAAQQAFFSETFQLSAESDRMGYRLRGPALSYARPEMAEIAACGTVWGAVQVPPDGQPIILMADHQITGGYPIIGVVAETDLPGLAQLLPGQPVRFVRYELDF